MFQFKLLCQLFTTYCCSFYGSQLWGANTAGFKRCTTESNKAIRRIVHVPYRTHRWLLGPLSGQTNIVEQLYTKTFRFLYSAMTHSNTIVRALVNRALSSAQSPMGAQIAYLRYVYGIDVYKPRINGLHRMRSFFKLDIWKCTYLNVLNDLKSCASGMIDINGFSEYQIDVICM